MKLITGNILEVMPELSDGSIDVILTSPPYNLFRNYGELVDDEQSFETYYSWLKEVWTECYRVLVSGGRLIVNIMPVWSKYQPIHHRISEDCRSLGFLWRNELIWDKHNWNARRETWGSWKSPSSPYFKCTWEFIEIFSKDSYKHDGTGPDITGPDFKKWVSNGMWSIRPETRNLEHPAPFPEELAVRLLQLFSFSRRRNS